MVKSLSDYQVSDEAFNLKITMDRILATVVAIYQRNNVPLPTRQYWVAGDASEDCEQVTVSLVQLYLGAPGDQATLPQHCNVPRTAVVNISVTRDYPIGQGGKAISASDLQKASEWSIVDSWILLDSLQDFDKWDDDGMPGAGVIGTVNALDPRGGVQTTRLNLTLAVG